MISRAKSGIAASARLRRTIAPPGVFQFWPTRFCHAVKNASPCRSAPIPMLRDTSGRGRHVARQFGPKLGGARSDRTCRSVERTFPTAPAATDREPTCDDVRTATEFPADESLVTPTHPRIRTGSSTGGPNLSRMGSGRRSVGHIPNRFAARKAVIRMSGFESRSRRRDMILAVAW